MTRRRQAALTISAKRKFDSELVRIGQHDPGAARRLAIRFANIREYLVMFPRMGRPTLKPGMRELIMGTYILSVAQVHGTPTILNIRDGRYELEAHPKRVAEPEPGDDDLPKP